MSEKKLFLHIGTGKTGSTAIQESIFAANRKGAFSDDICYPLLLGKHHHNELCCLVMDHDRIRRDIKSKYPQSDSSYDDYKEKLKDALVKELATEKNVLISGEYFCGFSRLEAERFVGMFRGLGFSQIHVCIYFREPVSLYLSQIQQRIKASSSFASPQSFFFDYEEKFEVWHDLVEKVYVREFRREKLLNNDVVDDFIQVVNESFLSNVIISKNFKDGSNESLSPASMAVIQDFRRMFYASRDNFFDAKTKIILKLLHEAEKNLGISSRPELRDNIVNIIRNKHSRQIQYLVEAHGFSPSGDSTDPVLKNVQYSHVKEVVKYNDDDDIDYKNILLFLLHELAS